MIFTFGEEKISKFSRELRWNGFATLCTIDFGCPEL